MRDRTVLELQGMIYEGVVGVLLREKRKDGVIIYNKNFKCNYLPRGETQVDIIFVTEKAVFIIEVKDWKYRIEGGYNDYEWEGMGKSLKTMTVFNPVYQNYGHIRLLKAALMQNENIPPLINLVVVPDGCKIKSDCEEVIHLSELCDTIAKYEKSYYTKYVVTDIVRMIREVK